MCLEALALFEAGRAEKELGEINADIARVQARQARVQGRENERRLRQDVRRLIGAQRTGFAGQNVLVAEGTAAELQADSARLGELDAITIRNNAALQAWGFRVSALAAEFRGETAEQLGRIGALGSLLGQAAKSAGGGGGGGANGRSPRGGFFPPGLPF